MTTRQLPFVCRDDWPCARISRLAGTPDHERRGQKGEFLHLCNCLVLWANYSLSAGASGHPLRAISADLSGNTGLSTFKKI